MEMGLRFRAQNSPWPLPVLRSGTGAASSPKGGQPGSWWGTWRASPSSIAEGTAATSSPTARTRPPSSGTSAG